MPPRSFVHGLLRCALAAVLVGTVLGIPLGILAVLLYLLLWLLGKGQVLLAPGRTPGTPPVRA